MSRASGKRTACMKSACVSVASARSQTKYQIKSARIPGTPMNPISPSRGESNTKVIANISQSALPGATKTQTFSLSRGEPNATINQSSSPDETQFMSKTASTRGDSNLINLTSNLQTCADLVNNYQLESYRRIVSKPERPPRAIDKINCALSLSNQNSINLTNSLQTCADLVNNYQIVSKPERPPRAIDKITSALAQSYNNHSKPKGRGAFAVAPVPEGDDYFEECHYESMIYSGAYRVGIYTRSRVISSYKPKVVSRAMRKAKRFLRKRSEPRTEANLKVKLIPQAEDQLITKSMSFLERASMKEAAEYETERAELNSKLSLSMCKEFETRTPEYRPIPNYQEVVTGYPETIAPLVMDSSHRRCASVLILMKQ